MGEGLFAVGGQPQCQQTARQEASASLRERERLFHALSELDQPDSECI